MRLMSMNVSEGRPDARWDPMLYLQFSDLRLRPALELLQRVPLDAPHYLQVVEGDDPVYDWIKASGLRAVTDHLDDSERGRFLAQYVPRLRKLYPNGADGRTLFPFRRLFVVAQVH